MLKLVTFNIRCDYDQDGANSFRFRKPVILKKLTEEKPDVICFQEVLPHVAAWLKENLTEYTVIGCGRSETLEDEQMTVAFRTKRLNLINMETFWLSPTPYVPASRYEEQSICPRVCTEVVLEDLQEKKVFRLCDIHLDHLGVQARTLGLSQILKKMDDAVLFANAPVILAGDFNAEPGQNGNFSLCKHYSFIGSREQGSNADYVVIPEQNAVVYDPSIPYEQAAMFEPATVAIHGAFQNDYQGGQYVAVLGGGTIGMFTMQWCKIFGSKKVVVFDISDERLELAKRLGADEVVNTTKENFMEEAMAITGGKGYGFVFETAGQVPTMHMAFELAGNKSHVCFIGTPHVNLEFTPAMWENMNRKEFKLTGSWMSYSAPFPGKEWDLTAHYFATGQLKFDKGFIYKMVPMSQAQEAFQMFKTPGLVQGKVMLVNED